ncbi:MAG: hypothetical protein AABY64_02525 [Bdellovibrionota bacterium]
MKKLWQTVKGNNWLMLLLIFIMSIILTFLWQHFFEKRNSNSEQIIISKSHTEGSTLSSSRDGQ